MLAMDIHHVVPNADFLVQETTQNTVGKEHTFYVEVGTYHHIGHRYVLWDNGNLISMQFHLYAVHLCLRFSAGTNHNGVHGHMSAAYLRKLLDTIHNHNFVVRIANLYVLVVS